MDPLSLGPSLIAQLAAEGRPRPYAAELARRLRLGSAGTGFFVNEEGYLVTNAHVVLGGVRYVGLHFTQAEWDSLARTLSTIRNVWITVGEGEDERSYVAEVVALAEHLDLAVLRVVAPPGETRRFAFLPLGSSKRLSPGQSVRSLGFNGDGFHDTSGAILSLIRGQQVHERMNIVRRRDPATGEESLTVSGTSPGPVRRIHHNAPVGHGNSGGPLLDGNGRVIAVAYALISDQREETGAASELSGLNLAIASEVLREFLSQQGVRFTEGAP